MIAAAIENIRSAVHRMGEKGIEALSRPECLKPILLMGIKEPFSYSPVHAPTPALTNFFETAFAGGLPVSAGGTYHACPNCHSSSR